MSNQEQEEYWFTNKQGERVQLSDADIERLSESECFSRQMQTGEACDVHPVPEAWAAGYKQGVRSAEIYRRLGIE